MLLQERTFLAVVSILQFLQYAANANHGYKDFTSQNSRKNDRHGRVILYRPNRHNRHFQDDQKLYYNRHSQNSGRVPYQNPQDVSRFTSHYEHNRWNRIPFNAGLDSNRQFDTRRGYSYPSSYNSQRKQHFHDREESIADYLKRYNFENNPQATFYNGPNDSNFNQPIEEEIIIEEEPDDYKHLTPDFPTDLGHKDLTKATFPGNRPSPGISNLPNKHHFSTENGPIHEDPSHFYYQKPDYDLSDDSSDKGIDPELIEIYKKVIEVYKKKQNQKKRQGKKPFYFGNPEKNNVNTFYLQDNNHLGHNAGKNYFNVPDSGSKSNIPTPYHPNNKGFVFPGPVQTYNKPAPTYPPFQASPQFHKYSEPDPLYHPKGNPFKLHETTHVSPAPTPLPQIATTSTIAPSVSDMQSTTENKNNFPDSINAQLPPPEKDTDTNVPYVAATIVTPKTSSETTLSIYSQTSSLTESASESPTSANLPPTYYGNETLSDESKMKDEDNVTSSTVPHFEFYSENFTSDNETSSTTVPATGQPELFFLPTAAEEISGSSSKESPIFQEIVPNFDDLNKPTTYRRNFTPSTTTLEISTSSESIIRNEVYPTTHTISTSNNANHKQEQNLSTYAVNMDNEMKIGEKEIQVSHEQIVETENQKFSNNNVPTDIHNISNILLTSESTTISHPNITAGNISFAKQEQEHFPTSKKDFSETTPKSNIKKSAENNHSTDSIHLEKTYQTTPYNILKAHKSDNFHYLMSIINQARTHVILSENDTHTDV